MVLNFSVLSFSVFNFQCFIFPLKGSYECELQKNLRSGFWPERMLFQLNLDIRVGTLLNWGQDL